MHIPYVDDCFQRFYSFEITEKSGPYPRVGVGEGGRNILIKLFLLCLFPYLKCTKYQEKMAIL